MAGPRLTGWVALLLFLGSIPLANWLVQHVGTVCAPGPVCLVPVAPGLLAPSGVLVVGLALVLRDVVQRQLGLGWSFAAILAGTVLSAALAPGRLVLASGAAFLASEAADLLVYTPLQRRRLVLAVIASGVAGLVVDSVLFLWLAFGSLAFLEGQVVGKLWGVMVSIPFIQVLRRVSPATA